MMLTFIKEETFYIFLKWLHHSLLGIVVSMLLGENILNADESHPPHIYYSFCSKKPIPWKEVWGSYVNKMFVFSQNIFVTAALISHIVLFLKQRQLEKQISERVTVVTYNMDGVTISSRGPDLPSSGKLWRHNRTAVTPKASFFSFLFDLVSHLLRMIFFIIFNKCHLGLPIYAQFLTFFKFCYLFFFCNLIETIFSPKLYKSLSECFLRSSREYHVVDV